MAGNAHPTSYIKSKHLGKERALITDGRFQAAHRDCLSDIFHPEAVAGGNIGLLHVGILFD